jgi:hypothetical protein
MDLVPFSTHDNQLEKSLRAGNVFARKKKSQKSKDVFVKKAGKFLPAWDVFVKKKSEKFRSAWDVFEKKQ